MSAAAPAFTKAAIVFVVEYRETLASATNAGMLMLVATSALKPTDFCSLPLFTRILRRMAPIVITIVARLCPGVPCRLSFTSSVLNDIGREWRLSTPLILAVINPETLPRAFFFLWA